MAKTQRKTVKKMWDGRFKVKTDPFVEEFTSSISYDIRLSVFDIQGSMAHVKMLSKIGVLKQTEEKKIISGLVNIAKDLMYGKIESLEDYEDIHMAIEEILTQRIGDVAKKIHTARSRNDQVALDMRLYLRAGVRETIKAVSQLQKTIIKFSSSNKDIVIPEMTHLQHAQPVFLAHHMLAYVNMLERDKQRIADGLKRINVMPLGAGACTGTGIPIDQKYVAKILGFQEISRNSVDAVSDRDFVIEFLSNLSLIAMHLSRLSEEMVLWSSSEFGFISIGDAYCTGSSMMPQKKNPDVCEIVRGKTGRIYGSLISLLTVMKALPLAYNRDMQEDKEPLFDALDTMLDSLEIFSRMFENVSVNSKACLEKTAHGYLEATDLAEYLVCKGVPFRQAHHIIGKLVSYCITKSIKFDELKLEEYKKFSKYFSSDVKEAILVKNCLDRKKSIGGTCKANVEKEIKYWQKVLSKTN